MGAGKGGGVEGVLEAGAVRAQEAEVDDDGGNPEDDHERQREQHDDLAALPRVRVGDHVQAGRSLRGRRATRQDPPEGHSTTIVIAEARLIWLPNASGQIIR